MATIVSPEIGEGVFIVQTVMKKGSQSVVRFFIGVEIDHIGADSEGIQESAGHVGIFSGQMYGACGRISQVESAERMTKIPTVNRTGIDVVDSVLHERTQVNCVKPERIQYFFPGASDRKRSAVHQKRCKK